MGFVFFVTTIPLGSKTLWQHASSIWKTEQTQELVDGVKRSSGPLVDKIKRGVEAGAQEMTRGPGANSPDPVYNVENNSDAPSDVDGNADSITAPASEGAKP